MLEMEGMFGDDLACQADRRRADLMGKTAIFRRRRCFLGACWGFGG